MKKHFYFLIFFLLSQLYILMANLHLIILASHTPDGAHFTYNHIAYWSMDYNVYLSVITQGMHGNWLMQDALTSELTNPSIFYFFYIVLGKISRIFQLMPDTAYVVAKLIGAEIFVITLYKLSTSILGKRYGFMASLFGLIASTLPLLFWDSRYFYDFWPWWARFDAIMRLDLMPHYLISWSLMSIGVICWLQYIRFKLAKWLTLAILLILSAGLFLPSSTIPFVTGIPLIWLYKLILGKIKQGKFITNRQLNVSLLFLVPAALTPLVFTVMEKWNGLPWSDWYSFEVNTWNHAAKNFNVEMLGSFSILPILALPAIWKSFRKADIGLLFLTFWAIIPYILLPVATPLALSKYRLISMAPFIPLSILSAQTISILYEKSKPKLAILCITLVVFLSLPSSGSILYQITRSAREYPAYVNIFLPQDLQNVLSFFKSKSSTNPIVISDWVGSNLVPAYAPVKVFAGHPLQTINFHQKTFLYTQFFRGFMTPDDAKSFLTQYGITHIMYGPAEARIGNAVTSYSFLNPEYTNGDYTIYRVLDHQ